MRCLLIACALAVVGTASAKDPPAGRPAFDLTLLPRGVGPGVIAFRPAELASHAGTADDTVGAVLAQSLKAVAAFLDGNLKVDDLPRVSGVEQAAFNLGLRVKLSGVPGESNFSLRTEQNSGYLRTTEKFDWSGLLKKAFPKAITKAYGEAEYLSVPFKLGQWEGAVGFFIPDERTLLFDQDTAQLEKWIDGRTAKKQPDIPAGWDDVKVCSVAYLLPAGDRSWLTTNKPLDSLGEAVADMVNATEVGCIGVTFGQTTTAVAVFTCPSEDNAKTSKRLVTRGLATLSEGAADTFGGEANASTVRTGKSVRADATVKANVVKHLLTKIQAGHK